MGRKEGLSELLTVLILIVILFVLAVSRFATSPKKVSIEQVKLMLQQIALQEEAYRNENKTYISVSGGEVSNRLSPGESDSVLFIKITPGTPYTYVWADVTDSTYRVTATGNLDDDPELDVWILDQTGTIFHSAAD